MKNLHLWLLVLVVFVLNLAWSNIPPVFAGGTEDPYLTVSELMTRIADGPGRSIVLVRIYEKNKQGNLVAEGHGSGVTFQDPTTHKSYVETSFHVPKDSVAFSAIFLDQSRPPVPLRLLGKDEGSDEALLEPIDPSVVLPQSRFGDSDKLDHDLVFAVGYPEDLRFNIFPGYISNPEALNSGKGDDCLADSPTLTISDARIAPGNSGGPLFNAQGEIIAVNSCITPSTAITISTPINYFTRILPMLENGKNVEHPKLGMLLRNTFEMTPPDYLEYQMEPPQAQGIVVVGVPDKSPAALAGIKKGDIIAAADGVAPLTLTQFLKMIYFHFDLRKPVTLIIHRDRATVLRVRIVPTVAAKLQDKDFAAKIKKSK